MSVARKMKFGFLASAVFILIASFALVSCSGGGGGAVAITAPWTGTKQLGVTGADTAAQGVAVDASGNVYVTGYTFGGLDGNTLIGSKDAFLTMYDPSGNKVRTLLTGTAGAVAEASSVAVDTNGNVYVAGSTTGGLDGNTLAGTRDYFVTKHDPAGNWIYTKQTGTLGGLRTVADCIAVDANGNVYVAGYTEGGLDGNILKGAQDAFLTKYDPSGNRVYTKQTGTTGKNTQAHGVAVDAGGNVYIAGYTTGGLDGKALMGTNDAFFKKYDILGNPLFTEQTGTTGALTVAADVAVDADGNVYVTGATNGALDGHARIGAIDAFLMKYDPLGAKLDTKTTGTTGKNTIALNVKVDTSGNIYIAGFTQGGLDGNTLTGIEDTFLIKYDPSLNKVRTKQLGAAGATTEEYGVAVDAGGNVYVAGSTDGGLDGNTLAGTLDFFVTKYDPAGNKQ
jgi:hypothetical protein